MGWCTWIPRPRASNVAQVKPTEVNGAFFRNLVTQPSFLPVHIVFQVLMFVICGGPIKLFLGAISFLLWMAVVSVLPFFASFFASPLRFKMWSYSLSRGFLRLFLGCIGVLKLEMSGQILPTSRVFVSNSISILDYLIHYYVVPVTFLVKDEHHGLERLLLKKFLKAFQVRVGKKKTCHQIASVASDPSFFPLMTFPEATSTNGDAVLSFERDCFMNEYPLQPVSIRYFLWFTPPGFNSLRFENRFSKILEFVWRVLSTPFITCNVEYLEGCNMKTDSPGPQLAERKAVFCQLALANSLNILAVDKVRRRIV
jgi:hypothetical protein